MLRVLTLLGILIFANTAQAKVLVFAAASMTEVVDKLADAFKAESGIEVASSFAGTGQLARQIDAGAPADVFISADEDWMKWLTKRDKIESDEVAVVAGNRLVVAVRGETENWADILGILTGSRFSMGDPNSVPAGKYAKQALTQMGLWEQVKTNAVFGENVRLAMKRLELGEVEAAIVYESDVQQAKNLRIGMAFRAKLHDPILYRAALVKGSKFQSEVKAFLEFLVSDNAENIFKEAGFADGKN